MSAKLNSPQAMLPFESDLNQIVKEYLTCISLDESAAKFVEECETKNKAIGTATGGTLRPSKKATALQNQLMQLFATGQRRDFFKLWLQNISPNVIDNDPLSKRLEFLLQVHFVCFPLRSAKLTNKDMNTMEENMAKFKQYLDTRGSELSHTPEFVPYFAMPYVGNPKQHPSFQSVFRDSWVEDLQRRLDQFLSITLESNAKPRLLELYTSSSRRDYETQVQRLQQQCLAAEKRANHFMKCFNRVQADYHGLISITAELVDTLESTVQGNIVQPEYLQQICVRLFNAQNIRKSADLSRPGTAGRILRSSIQQGASSEQELLKFIRKLDFAKMQDTLSDGENRAVAYLLQALRWQLTQTQAGAQRQTVLKAFINHDIIFCAQPESQQHRTILKRLSDKDISCRQYVARFLNTLASLCRGRAYLAQASDHLLPALTAALNDTDQTCAENALGCLQKLSLRKNLQNSMIESDLILWLTNLLKDPDNLSDYTLEYAVALLMNLCLRTAGKKKCADNPTPILKILTNLLSYENQGIKPYINGVLYSILGVPEVREAGISMGLEEELRMYMKDDQPDMTRQYHFIIKQLQKTETQLDSSQSDNEDDDDDDNEDALETELDKDELLEPNDLSGEQLLLKDYSATNRPNSGKSTSRTPMLPIAESPSTSTVINQRPMTPKSRPSSRHTPVDQQTDRPRSSAAIITTQPRRLISIATVEENSHHPSSQRTNRDVAYRPRSHSLGRKASRRGSFSRRVSNDEITDANGEIQQLERPPTRGNGSNVSDPPEKKEKETVFNSKPKIPRTPDPRGTRSVISPKYSGAEPKQRPNSGGQSRIYSPESKY